MHKFTFVAFGRLRLSFIEGPHPATKLGTP